MYKRKLNAEFVLFLSLQASDFLLINAFKYVMIYTLSYYIERVDCYICPSPNLIKIRLLIRSNIREGSGSKDLVPSPFLFFSISFSPLSTLLRYVIYLSPTFWYMVTYFCHNLSDMSTCQKKST